MANEYVTLTQIKADLRIESTDVSEDALINDLLTDASRAIDDWCRTRFYVTAGEVRYFTPNEARRLTIGQATAVTAVELDEDGNLTWETALTASDWVLEPLNASADGEPYREIVLAPQTTKHFPLRAKSVRVTGSFGWSVGAPIPVVRACRLLVARLYKRRDAPLGVIEETLPDAGGLSLARVQTDTDIQSLLNRYRSDRWVLI